MADRVAVFVDMQNVYGGARRTFYSGVSAHHTDGQIDPLALGNLICSRPPPGLTRTLSEVRVYTGRPESTKEPKTYGAHMRQCEAWERAGAVVIPRPLRYPGDWPDTRAEQKGVDVQLAIDFVAGAIDDRYDVGVMFSTDTDLRPALEFVTDRFERYPRAEVAAWRGSGANRSLRVRGGQRSTWVHFLDWDDYLAIRDRTDYLL
ncbi:MAG: NYN domain-containing protein [Chloroflexi bacterium]|nr:NYN domain-containing protein [Chloroflexota bacterium]